MISSGCANRFTGVDTVASTGSVGGAFENAGGEARIGLEARDERDPLHRPLVRAGQAIFATGA
jgi:hypothetical protein